MSNSENKNHTLRDEINKEINDFLTICKKNRYFKFDFIITDIETIIASDDIIEEIQVVSIAAPLLQQEKSIFEDDDDEDYYYLVIF